jgi:Domain of unknown function (DUF3859)
MKSIVIAVAALLLSAPALAQTKVTGAEIVEYGIYTAEIQTAKRDSNGVLQSNLGDISHATTTTSVPARHGVRFGFRYKITGTPDGATIPLKFVTVFPPAGLSPPNMAQPIHNSESGQTVKIGDTGYHDYGFDDPWELVPGPWTIQIWYGKTKLAEKNFTVTAP